jgi:hypothetical protein
VTEERPGAAELRHARELQAKFDIYFLGLTFTLLGLAVQTAKFGRSRAGDLLELGGWIALIVSSLAGLSRLVSLPSTYAKLAALEHWRDRKRRFDLARTLNPYVDDDTRGYAPDELVAESAKSERKIRTLQSENHLQSGGFRHLAHRWLFVAGLLLLACARGYESAVNVLTDHYPASTTALPARQDDSTRSMQ